MNEGSQWKEAVGPMQMRDDRPGALADALCIQLGAEELVQRAVRGLGKALT
jgi:hypothetical protein